MLLYVFYDNSNAVTCNASPKWPHSSAPQNQYSCRSTPLLPSCIAAIIAGGRSHAGSELLAALYAEGFEQTLGGNTHPGFSWQKYSTNLNAGTQYWPCCRLNQQQHAIKKYLCNYRSLFRIPAEFWHLLNRCPKWCTEMKLHLVIKPLSCSCWSTL